MNTAKEYRIKVFEDTVSTTHEYDRRSHTALTNFNGIRIPDLGNEIGKVTVENSDTVSSAVKWSKEGKVCILNMASYKKPGGGVRTGQQAQEECLFRCSNLWETVSSDFYPLADDEALITRDAIFFKDKFYNKMDPITVDVVTVAAINLNKDSYFDKDNDKWVNVLREKPDNYEVLTKNKIRLMLSVSNAETIILGAWGCGVFKNDPEEMAKMFKEVIEDGYGKNHKNIVFAIINDENSHGDNFDTFNEILG